MKVKVGPGFGKTEHNNLWSHFPMDRVPACSDIGQKKMGQDCTPQGGVRGSYSMEQVVAFKSGCTHPGQY